MMCQISIDETTARALAGFTTGKLTTLNNHLLQCDFCPEAVKKCARVWKGTDEGEDGMDFEPTASESPKQSSKRTRTNLVQTSSRTKKQKTFTVISAKAHSFPPSKQSQFEEQLLRAIISAGWSFNSISDPEVQKLFNDFIPGASVPTRQKLSTKILVREIDKIHADVKNTSKGAYATIQCDGYKDNSKKHLVAFLYTANREASVLIRICA
jgi:hypothetical protein